MELDSHLFRRESGRIVAALTRVFGIHNLALVEDVVQDALCRALEVWKFHGPPENPSAWIIATAKNRAIDVLRREKTARTYAPELGRLLESEWTLLPTVAEQFEPHAIQHGQLRMMFACCDPHLANEVQIALVLNILCGFGPKELAGAFLCSEAAIEKRLSRGKKVLADSKKIFDAISDDELAARLTSVHRALYLLFNEGYHGVGTEVVVQPELCAEAIFVASMLLAEPRTNTPETNALLALMCLHAARLPARQDADGQLLNLFEQDRSLWDRELADKGAAYLAAAASGGAISAFHIEAALAQVHLSAESRQTTRWDQIVFLYDQLLRLQPTPVVALNRAIAIGEHEGAVEGLRAIDAIADAERLSDYPFYYAARAELELRLQRVEVARRNFEEAKKHARNQTEARFFERRALACSIVLGL